MKLTGAAILVSRGMKVLQAAPGTLSLSFGGALFGIPGGRKMRRINATLVLALLFCPVASVAQDKKETRSLAADAAYLAEKGGKHGWLSEKVAVSFMGGEESPEWRVRMDFGADKGKPSGKVVLALLADDMVAMNADFIVTKVPFELVEKDGKRFIKIERRGLLEYEIKSDGFTVKGERHELWLDWKVNLTKPAAFKVCK
jgi:hypothetical protein